MRGKIIVLSLAAVLCDQQTASAQVFGTGDPARDYQRLRQVWGDPGERKQNEASSEEGCGFGCVLFLGVIAGLAYEHLHKTSTARTASPDQEAPPDNSSHTIQLDWQVKEFTGEATSWPYLNMYAEASTDAPVIAGLKPGFGGIHITGECLPALGKGGMCPVGVVTQRGELEGWVLSNMIEVVPDTVSRE